MDFELTQDQQMLVESAATFVKRESPPGRVRKLRGDPRGWSTDLWRKMGELGWLGVSFPETAGGLGGSFVDVALVLEQFGTSLVAEPYIASVVLAGNAIAMAGDSRAHERWLAPMLAGETSLAFGYAERGSRYQTTSVHTRAERRGAGYVLTGEKAFVVNGHTADAIVMSARTAGAATDRGGISLFVVPKDANGLAITPMQTIDGHRAAMVKLSSVELSDDHRLGEDGAAADVIERVLDHGAAAAVAEGVGILRAVLSMTTEYLNTREQFGVKIGTFQALQHRAVEMFVEVQLVRSMAIMAAIKVGDADRTERMSAVSAAKAHLGTSGKFVTQQAIQLHGGIGVTDEHDVGLYFKRMHALNTLFGDEEWHVARYAALPTFEG